MLDVEFLVDDLFHFDFSSHCLLASLVSDEKPAINLMRISYTWCAIFLLSISRFFLCLLTVCVGVALLDLTLLRVFWASWIYRLMFFIKFGKFMTIIFEIFSLLFSLSSLLLGAPLCRCWDACWCPTVPWDPVYPPPTLYFPSLRLGNLSWPRFKFANSFF